MAMQERHLLICGSQPADDWQCLQTLLASASVVGLCRPEEEAMLRQALRPAWRHQGGRAERLDHGDTRPLLTMGPQAAVVVGSGGSRGQRRWCLQPLETLQRAAQALVGWPARMGRLGSRTPGLALAGLANPLPLHHVSGLMPPLRSQALGIPHRFLSRCQWRDKAQRPALQGWGLVLVPSQVQWLMEEPGGVDWLQQLACCWVGGAPLGPTLRQQARRSGLNLSPCYGSTETSAMVAALAPPAIPGWCGGLWAALAPRGAAHRLNLRLSPELTRGFGNPHPGADPRLPGGWTPGALASGERLVAHHGFSSIGNPRLAGFGPAGRGHQQWWRDGVSRGG